MLCPILLDSGCAPSPCRWASIPPRATALGRSAGLGRSSVLHARAGAAVYVRGGLSRPTPVLILLWARECPRLQHEGFEVPEGNVATWLLAFSLLSNSETRFRVDADSVSVRLRACGPAAVGWPQESVGWSFGHLASMNWLA